MWNSLGILLVAGGLYAATVRWCVRVGVGVHEGESVRQALRRLSSQRGSGRG